ncbi:MAG: hypothetical protein Q7T77_04915 [Sulfuricurvum sp.]|nr:hypothetical protein [Sulfuricurvum sp.]
MAQVPIRIEKIIRELVPVKEEIIKWRDSNETNCSVGMDKLYEFDFVGVWGKAFGAADRESTTESEDQNASSTQRPES